MKGISMQYNFNYSTLTVSKRNVLRKILRRWNIKYGFKVIAFKKSGKPTMNRKVADISEKHVIDCIKKIKAHDNKRVDGTCKLIQNKATLKILSDLLKG